MLAACSSPPATTSQSSFSYLGEVQFPSGFLFDDTTVGGLSAISYDPGRQVYYVISDDRSEKDPARFYTVRITFSDNRLGSVEWVRTTRLLDRTGAPFAPLSPGATPPVIPPDPEGIAFDEGRQQLYWSSEGERIVRDPAHPLLLDPWVRVAGFDGAFRAQFELPSVLTMSAQDTGPRTNMTLEGLTLTPSGRYVFAGMEDPGYNDGNLPTPDAGALTRITRFDADAWGDDRLDPYHVVTTTIAHDREVTLPAVSENFGRRPAIRSLRDRERLSRGSRSDSR